MISSPMDSMRLGNRHNGKKKEGANTTTTMTSFEMESRRQGGQQQRRPSDYDGYSMVGGAGFGSGALD